MLQKISFRVFDTHSDTLCDTNSGGKLESINIYTAMGAIQSSNSFPYFQFHLTPSVEEVEEEERRERQQNEQRTGGGKDWKGKNRNSDK